MSIEHEAIDELTLTEDQLLTKTQEIRQQLIAELTADGKMPTAPRDVEVLLAGLRDTEDVILKKKKLSIEADANANAKQANVIAEQLYKKLGNINPFLVMSGTETNITPVTGHLPKPDLNRLPTFATHEGHLEIGIIQDTSDDFIKRMESKS